MNKPVYYLLSFCLLLSACSNTPSTSTFTPAAVENGLASIYVYRPPEAENVLYAPELYINGAFRLKISNGRKLHFSLPAEPARVEIKSDYSTIGSSSLTLDLEAGQTRFLRVDTTLELDNNISGYTPYRRGFTLHEVAAGQAIAEIADCCPDGDTHDEPAASGKEDAPATDGFSGDKTHNPFSH